MATQAKAPPAVPDGSASSPQPRKFTVAEYYRIGDVGILKPDERVELIEGELIVMPHSAERLQQVTANCREGYTPVTHVVVRYGVSLPINGRCEVVS